MVNTPGGWSLYRKDQQNDWITLGLNLYWQKVRVESQNCFISKLEKSLSGIKTWKNYGTIDFLIEKYFFRIMAAFERHTIKNDLELESKIIFTLANAKISVNSHLTW